MRTLILLLVVVTMVYIARYLWQKKGYTPRQINQKLILYGASILLLVLILSGRLPWLFGAIGAAILAMGRLLPLIHHVPFLHGLYQRYQASQNGSFGSGGGQTSSAKSRYLRMILNHASGEMDGEVLLGSMQGRRLSELPMTTLLGLLSEFSDDQDSQALLQTYLDRMREDWREQTNESQSSGRQNKNNVGASAQMSLQEAYEILGVETQASKEQIIAAHRRLIQKLHPDRGGSSYLAAKINKAKDVLLKNRG